MLIKRIKTPLLKLLKLHFRKKNQTTSLTQGTAFQMHFVQNLWQIRWDTCNFYITFIFRSVPTWRLPKNRPNLTFQISILLHTRNASFRRLSWLSEPCAVPVFSSSTLSHVAYCAQARHGLQVAMCNALQDCGMCPMWICSKITKLSLPFWLLFVTKRAPATSNLSGDVKTKLCQLT